MQSRIIDTAIKRASKWMQLREAAQQMTGQVGGINANKKPILSLKPDYVLKPLYTDHRGLRELAFYEAMMAASRTTQHYASFLRPKTEETSKLAWIDTVAVALSILWQDPVVMEQEARLKDAWKQVKKEADALDKLSNFTASYYGVIGQKKFDRNCAYGIHEDAHLLLQDVTSNFVKPFVIDLKMGSQSYEPDATVEKRTREYSKYPQQALFGFRIVGMRYHEPSHPDADESGFVLLDKEYGRSLNTRDQLLEAFRIFFTAGMRSRPHDSSCNLLELAESPVDHRKIRTKTISNLLQLLRGLRRWFDENESNFRFYASSVLLVFEGDVTKTKGSDLGRASLKMIDFGRVRRADAASEESKTDEGYRKGLRTLNSLLIDLLDEDKAKSISILQSNGTKHE